MEATYKKLRDSSWGVFVTANPGEVTPGSRVAVTKKNRAIQMETVQRIIWAGPSNTSHGKYTYICSIVPRAIPYANSRRRE